MSSDFSVRQDETNERWSTNALRVRPQLLDDFIGQSSLKAHLRIYIDAARKRKEPMDHMLLSGPPGMGKTSLSAIVANELQSNLRRTSGPILERSGDLAAILTSLEAHDVLFIDEIHRMNRTVEETLYSALEDFKLDIIVGEGIGASSVRLDLPPFTLVGATTRSGLLSAPLRDRFGIVKRIEYYSDEELAQVVLQAAKKLDTPLQATTALAIATRSRGTPRIALRLLRRMRDFFVDQDSMSVQVEQAIASLDQLGIDETGLDQLDRQYLRTIGEQFQGGPVGLSNLSASVNEEADTLEEVVEPFLIRQGLIQRTPKGRVLTPKGVAILSGMHTKQNDRLI